MTDTWQPEIGQLVWMNRPDGRMIGTCVGYVDEQTHHRHGQPIIEDGDERFIIHPLFLLPFEHGSEEHRAAMKAQRA